MKTKICLLIFRTVASNHCELLLQLILSFLSIGKGYISSLFSQTNRNSAKTGCVVPPAFEQGLWNSKLALASHLGQSSSPLFSKELYLPERH